MTHLILLVPLSLPNRILQEFTDKYQAGDSPRDAGLGPLQTPPRYMTNNVTKEKEKDRERDKDSETGRMDRSDSVSSINSLGSSTVKGIASPPHLEKGSGNGNANGNGELKSILRKKTHSLPPSARSTPPPTPFESVSPLQSHSSTCVIRPATSVSTPGALSITSAGPILVPASQTLSSMFSLSPLGISNSLASSRSSSQSILIGESINSEEIQLENADRDMRGGQKAGSSPVESEEDNISAESSFSCKDGAVPLLTFVDRLEGTSDDLFNFNEEEKKSKLKMIAVVSESLPVSLDQFASMFIEENAPFNMKRYVTSSSISSSLILILTLYLLHVCISLTLAMPLD